MVQKIYIGSDHAGFELKEKLIRWFERKSIFYEDVGALKFNPTDDFPDYALKVANAVVRSKSLGILVCGSGQGMCITANKVKGIRAVIPSSLREARLSRKHDNANIMCLSGWYTNFHKATTMIERFMKTPFSREPKRIRRLNKIKRIET